MATPTKKAATNRKAATPPSGTAAKPTPTAVAFFDFDNTLIDGDAGPLFGRHLMALRRRGLTRWGRFLLSCRYVPYIFWMSTQAGLYALRARRRSNLIRSAYRGLRGVPLELFERDLDAFVDEAIPPLVYPDLVKEIEGHLAAGRRCVVVTTGMERLVARAMWHFPKGVEIIGCRLRDRDGRLTGRVVGPLFGVDKANIMDAYCRAIGVSLTDCYAYSDHYSDKHMLEAVGHPVAVNPRKRFGRLAAKNGWRIIRPEPAGKAS